MNGWLLALIVLVLITNVRLLAASRMFSCIRVAALQAALLSVLPVALLLPSAGTRFLLQAAVSGGVKSLLLPWLLRRAVQGAAVRRELEPLVGYTTSLVVGAGMLALALWLGCRLPNPSDPHLALLSPVSLFTIMTGLFLIVARRKAVTQVVGYLVMENGITAFGLAFARHQPLLVELGILLDVFAAVFVMGIAICHINREFDSMDTSALSALRD